MTFYPLTFAPILKPCAWGGDKLRSRLGKPLPRASTAGESWELSAVPGSISVVNNGAWQGRSLHAILEPDPQAILGAEVYRRFGAEFPLLVKFIDARSDLSIQVHPNDALARKRHNCLGKPELWYVMESEENARLIAGFKNNSNAAQYLEHLNNNTLRDIVQEFPAETGAVFFLDPGTIHSIGAGVLLAEIQQTSDITYRVYDWDRVDAQGQRRELHLEQALEAMNYQVVEARRAYTRNANQPNCLTESPYFTCNYLPLDGTLPVAHSGASFRIYVCVAGHFSIDSGTARHEFKLGDTVLMPAALRDYTLSGQAILLEAYL
ncbi:MAG: class I mannose-6-phosphate isomerase [Pseudomonadales bacterium]|jgi:mannose-6-phosphate isomerase|nr:class I mannose-6-phosphate isomerase [Pseudomonadales bacterium]